MRITHLIIDALGVLALVLLALVVLCLPYLTGELTLFVPNLGGYHLQID